MRAKHIKLKLSALTPISVIVHACPRLPAPAPGSSSPFRTPWWAALNTTSLLAAAVPPALPGSHLISSNKTTQKMCQFEAEVLAG
uniref:Uncharacterized protein n=1 Tax=Coturnix japonica TaxID=93934 RepID=A0A8C2Y656_COTJA